MGEILAVGITHYPPLAGRDESMAWILKRMLENPHLPEKLRHSENWPEAMRKEWSTDEGAAAARVHREQLLQSLRRTRAQIDEFRPDFIVIWGDDQYENFRERIRDPRWRRRRSRYPDELGLPLLRLQGRHPARGNGTRSRTFFDDLPIPNRQLGRPAEHLATVLSTAARTLERHPNFLRLLIVFAVQPPARASGEIEEVVTRVRRLGLDRLREQIALAFGDDPDKSPVTIRLARIALAAIDGAFVASQADPAVTLEELLEPLAPAVVGARRALLAKAH